MRLYTITPLTKKLANKYLDTLTTLIQQIPKTNYSSKDVLAEEKNGTPLLGKWEHSFIALDAGKVCGVIVGYVRKAEQNELYPKDTLYINWLAVASAYQHQGIARRLIQRCLATKGTYSVCIQTNIAAWNARVQNLYTGIGFVKRAEKVYENRIDNIYELKTL